jgi:hypothetical protein
MLQLEEVLQSHPGAATLAFACLLLASCATGSVYQNVTTGDAACIDGALASFKALHGEGAHAAVNAIDGILVNRRRAPFCVAPGHHELHVSATGFAYTAWGTAMLEFQPGRRYVLRARNGPERFVFEQVDVTDGKESIVVTFYSAPKNEEAPRSP